MLHGVTDSNGAQRRICKLFRNNKRLPKGAAATNVINIETCRFIKSLERVYLSDIYIYISEG